MVSCTSRTLALEVRVISWKWTLMSSERMRNKHQAGKSYLLPLRLSLSSDLCASQSELEIIDSDLMDPLALPGCHPPISKLEICCPANHFSICLQCVLEGALLARRFLDEVKSRGRRGSPSTLEAHGPALRVLSGGIRLVKFRDGRRGQILAAGRTWWSRGGNDLVAGEWVQGLIPVRGRLPVELSLRAAPWSRGGQWRSHWSTTGDP